MFFRGKQGFKIRDESFLPECLQAAFIDFQRGIKIQTIGFDSVQGAQSPYQLTRLLFKLRRSRGKIMGDGRTEFGRAVVKELDRRSVIIDLAHSSPGRCKSLGSQKSD